MPRPQWETMLVVLSREIHEQSDQLARHGREGWQLVAVAPPVAYLQRRLEPPPPSDATDADLPFE